MAYEISFTKRFAKKVVRVSEYLENEWSVKVAAEFLAKVDEKILSLSINPKLGSSSIKFPGIRKLRVTKHNRIYYKVEKQKVILIDFVETKMDPKRNRYE